MFSKDIFVRQAEAGECGLACLAMIAAHHGNECGLPAIRRRFPLSARGCSMRDLVAIADHLALNSRPIRAQLGALANVSLPAILHWDLNHYVVIARSKTGPKGTRFLIYDPAQQPAWMTEAEVSEHFTGIALELAPAVNFTPVRRRDRLRISQLWSRMVGVRASLLRVLALSAIMQLLALAAPLYMQLAIDNVLPAADADLLLVLAMGFGGLLLVNATATWVRNNSVLTLGNSLSLQTSVNLFRHVVHLPTHWFEKRHLGDITSRFGSLQPINDQLSQGLVSALVDGFLAMTTLLLMLMYSPFLTALTSVALSVYLIVRVVSFQALRFTNANVLNAQASESSSFLENMRGISTIKVFAQETPRLINWQAKRRRSLDGSLKLNRLSNAFETANTVVLGLEHVVFVFFAIGMVFSGTFTLGMVFAFQAYKQSFVGAATRFIDQAFRYRLLNVHLDRISDIALETREPAEIVHAADAIESVQLVNVSFSYGLGLPPVLDGVSLRIDAGRTTVLAGASGAGKTTILKILCGLLMPTSGEILVNGVPLRQFGLRAFRQRLGVVSQDDSLFAGSIAENISFFDPDHDERSVIDSCKAAAIHEDIMRMGMKYDSLVGDMGLTLSGGQRQRVLLARAIYRKPDLLLMDEGTANLDLETERSVIASLDRLAITRLMISHKPETIEAADVCYVLQGGRAYRRGPPLVTTAR